jgi:uncharacterized caspase-like protein
VLTLLLLASPAAAEAASRGISVELRESEAAGAAVVERVQLYPRSYAFVIGIDDYTNGWPGLQNAVADARAVAKALKVNGFDVTLKTDLKSAELRLSLREFFARKGADFDARLLLWFAGHGHSIGGEGFLVPADAPPANHPDFKVTALHMRDFGGLMRLADANHVLSIFDACFSGTIFTARAGATPKAITAKTVKPVRQFITSGTAGQAVRDDGSFRTLFLRALSGASDADFNADRYVTGEELGLYLSQQVTTLTEAAQTPRYGKLHDVRYNEGDFVFRLRRPAAAAPATTSRTESSPAVNMETVFWQSIEDSDRAADFEAYLVQFPNGAFTTLARNRLNGLQRVAAVPTPPKPEVTLEPVEVAYVTIKNANVRAEPNVGSTKVTTLPAGTELFVPGKTPDGKWLKVERDGKGIGYVYAALLQDKEAQEAAQKRGAEDAKRHRAELEAQRQAAAEARRRDEEKRQRVEEAERVAAEEQARKRAEAEVRRKAEEERQLAAVVPPKPKEAIGITDGDWHVTITFYGQDITYPYPDPFGKLYRVGGKIHISNGKYSGRIEQDGYILWLTVKQIETSVVFDGALSDSSNHPYLFKVKSNRFREGVAFSTTTYGRRSESDYSGEKEVEIMLRRVR